MEIEITSQFDALSHPHRLAVLRLLLRRYPNEVPAGEIASALGLKPNTLSTYLSHLMRAGLITQARHGTSLHYGAHIAGLRHMTDGLFRGALHARPDVLALSLIESLTETSPMTDRKYNVLFICTGNSARSIFAESILSHVAGDRFVAHSAGTKPTSELNRTAVQLLHDKGLDISGLTSKNVSVYQAEDAPEFDFVFTVCDQAANEDCPVWSGQQMTAHWGTPDPVKAVGTDAQKMLAFQHAFGMLRNRIIAFSALPFETLNRLSLQNALDDIGQMEAPE
ncbi:MAG: helix-turn-helix domain-containing protein [Octadecabacter sp.]|nr:helix-turn-helix domain-containing protein [Octadecabacter sp.]